MCSYLRNMEHRTFRAERLFSYAQRKKFPDQECNDSSLMHQP